MATRRNSRETYFLAVIRCTLQHPERCLSLDEPTCYQVSAKSVQHTIFSGVAHLDRMHFDVVLRKLISQQQACPHCIDKSIASSNKLIRGVPHEGTVGIGAEVRFVEAGHRAITLGIHLGQDTRYHPKKGLTRILTVLTMFS